MSTILTPPGTVPPVRPVINPSPKSRFMESADNISKHRAMVDRGEFQRALDYAMMQYVARISVNTETGTSASNMFKICGAQEFAQELRLLADEWNPPVRRVLPQNLNHDA